MGCGWAAVTARWGGAAVSRWTNWLVHLHRGSLGKWGRCYHCSIRTWCGGVGDSGYIMGGGGGFSVHRDGGWLLGTSGCGRFGSGWWGAEVG